MPTIEKVTDIGTARAAGAVMADAYIAHPTLHKMQRNQTLSRVFRSGWVADLETVLAGEIARAMGEGDRLTLCARDGETIHGAVLVVFNELGVVVEDIAVRRDLQRQGIGRQLMEAVMEESLSLKRFHLTALVEKDDRIALSFFAKWCGFMPDGIELVRRLEPRKAQPALVITSKMPKGGVH